MADTWYQAKFKFCCAAALVFCGACGSKPSPLPSLENSGAASQTTMSTLPLPPLTLSLENWGVVYDGFGLVTFDNWGITLAPKAATSNGETHAALVLSKKISSCPVKDFELSIQATTVKQLRTPTPNPWEVFWIFFNYVPEANLKKTTNYFILKTNGIELGKAFEERGQTFLYTANNPTLGLGSLVKYTIKKVGSTITIFLDDVLVLHSVQPLYDQPGSLGLYSEDAIVKIQAIQFQSLDSSVCGG